MSYKSVLISHPSETERTTLKSLIDSDSTHITIREASTEVEAEMLIKEQDFDIILTSMLLSILKHKNLGDTRVIGLIPDDTTENINRLEFYGIKHYQIFPTPLDTLRNNLAAVTRQGRTRQHPRYDVPGTKVIFHTDDLEIEGKILDISEGGFLCEMLSNEEIDFGQLQAFTVTIRFPRKFGGRSLQRVKCNYLTTRKSIKEEDGFKNILVMLIPNLEERDFESLVVTFQKIIKKQHPLLHWTNGRLEMNLGGRKSYFYGIHLFRITFLSILVLVLLGLSSIWGWKKLKESLDEARPKVGLTTERILLADKIEFNKGDYSIQPESFEMLDEMAKLLQRNKRIRRISIDGHTDSAGSEDFNRQLSMQRAEAVKDYLVEKGIEYNRLLTRGFGSDRPIGDNSQAIGRQLNRRVEFIILEQSFSN